MGRKVSLPAGRSSRSSCRYSWPIDIGFDCLNSRSMSFGNIFAADHRRYNGRTNRFCSSSTHPVSFHRKHYSWRWRTGVGATVPRMEQVAVLELTPPRETRATRSGSHPGPESRSNPSPENKGFHSCSGPPEEIPGISRKATREWRPVKRLGLDKPRTRPFPRKLYSRSSKE